MLISKYGAMAGGPRVRVMYANNGTYYTWPTTGVAIAQMVASVKFLAQPTGYFYQSKDANSVATGNEIHWLYHGQTTCIRSDQSYTSVSCSSYTFPLNKWLDVTWNDNLGGNTASISVIGYTGRTVTCANVCHGGSSVPYQHYLFPSGVSAYFRRLQLYKAPSSDYGSNSLWCDWDFENGDNVPSGWSNCTIKEVSL